MDGKTETAEVFDLYPWMEYEFRVYTINEVGAGESSLPSIKIKTWDASEFPHSQYHFDEHYLFDEVHFGGSNGV